ncbi:hypothetical protein ACT3D0_001572 [Vibrio vulnificus]
MLYTLLHIDLSTYNSANLLFELNPQMAHINLRSSLMISTEQFCNAVCIADNSEVQNQALVELIFLIARYQEEGIKLHPKVYLTSDIDTALKMLPGQASMKIGLCSCFHEAVKTALKKCAPLAINGWCIYISQRQDHVEYGIFRGDTNPTSVNIDNIILTDELPFKTIKIHQVASDSVQVKSSEGGILNVSLNHTLEESNTPIDHLDHLVDRIVSNVQHNKEQVTNYLTRLLGDAIKKSHGCLIAVSNTANVPVSLVSDGTCLSEPINFQSLVSMSLEREKDAGNLISMGQLLEGMLSSDGIVVFDNSSQLLAFNCFTPLPEATKGNSALGGARYRAYEALSILLDSELDAVFMQSQDGFTQFKGAQNG